MDFSYGKTPFNLGVDPIIKVAATGSHFGFLMRDIIVTISTRNVYVGIRWHLDIKRILGDC